MLEIEVPVSTVLEQAKNMAISQCLLNKCRVDFTFNGKMYSVYYDHLMNQVQPIETL